MYIPALCAEESRITRCAISRLSIRYFRAVHLPRRKIVTIVVIEARHPSYMYRPAKYTLLRRAEQGRRRVMRPIAIGTYKVRDTRHNIRDRVFPSPRCANVSYILRRRQVDHVEEHLRQSEADGRANGSGIDLSRQYINSFNALRRTRAFHRRRMREINYYRVRAAAS